MISTLLVRNEIVKRCLEIKEMKYFILFYALILTLKNVYVRTRSIFLKDIQTRGCDLMVTGRRNFAGVFYKKILEVSSPFFL